MKHFRSFLLPVLLLTIVCPVQPKAAVPGFFITRANEPLQSLKENLLIYKDETGERTIADFISGNIPASAFETFDSAKHSGSYKTLWCKITIQATYSLHGYLLALKEVPIAGLEQGNDVAEIWIVNESGIKQHFSVGNLIPESARLIKEPINRNAIPFSIDSGEQQTVIMKLAQTQIKRPVQIDFALFHPVSIALFSEDSFIHLIEFYSGIMAILFMFGFIFFVITRQAPFLWFSIITGFYVLHSLLLHPFNLFVKWLVPETPLLAPYAWFCLTAINQAIYIQFGRSFINTRRVAPRIDKIMIGLIVFMVGYFLFDVFSLTFNPPVTDTGIAIGIFFIGLFSTGIALTFKKDFNARWFGIATCWLCVFQTAGILWGLGILPDWTLNPWTVAQVGNMVIIFFGLAYRFRKAEQEKAEGEKIKELDKIKSRFFANISHEFRTPLTLMLAPIKQLEEGTTSGENVKRYFRIMRQNGERLLHLINQLLDLSKLESGKLGLRTEKTDITSFLKLLVHSFDSMAEQKQINYHVHFPEQEIIGWLDRDKVSKIVSNLLANAFRFTPENGSVSIEAEADSKRLRFSVQDSGTGIPKEQLDKIFDRFYQVEGTEGGSGIGLSLVKELIQLHRGQVAVSSETGKGATFRISIPIAREFYSDEEVSASGIETFTGYSGSELSYETEAAESSPESGNGVLPKVLVVEDHPDLRSFIQDTLKGNFTVITSENGKSGLEKAIEEIPDLIVTDVMMPVMNGVDMCEKLKKNEKTTHIPVIMLTAKATKENRIEGLKTGADDYLVKPFDSEELIVRINNLIESRKKLREKFSRQIISVTPEEIEEPSQENEFLKKIRTALEENLDNELFSVVDLANVVNMSRSQLHRKLKALTDAAPNELIRNFRLERAMQLLRQQNHNVNEVAFMTGFSSPAYFSKCFNEKFGTAPGEVRRQVMR